VTSRPPGISTDIDRQIGLTLLAGGVGAIAIHVIRSGPFDRDAALGMEILTTADFRADLEVTLQLARERCASVPDYKVYQRILMELEAMREWTGGGRNPTVAERKRIDIGLMAVRELEGVDDPALDDFCGHLHGLNYAFDFWPLLLTEPPRKLVPAVAKGTEIGSVRLSPDGTRLAFWCADEDPPGVFVVSADSPRECKCLVLSDGWTAGEIRWSPDGQYVAFMASSGPPPGELKIGWVSAEGAWLPQWLEGMSFAWGARGSTLLAADVPAQIIWCRDVASGTARSLGWFEDDGDPHFPPRLVASPRGDRVAITTRRVEGDFTRVWIFEGKGKAATIRLLTEMPGAGFHVCPFWSPDGKDLGLRVIDLGGQENLIMVFEGTEGKGTVVHRHELVDDAQPALWLPGGRWIAFLKTREPQHEFTKSGPQSLALLDGRATDCYAPEGLGILEGEPRRHGESGMVIDGRSSATLLNFTGPLNEGGAFGQLEGATPVEET